MHTQLCKITDLKKHQKWIQEAAELLKQGQCVVFPTETVYGLGANALDEEAVKRVYEIKNRPADNPLIVHVADKKALQACAEQLSPEAHALIDAFCPGPLSVLVRKKKEFPSYATAGSDKICLRIPSHPVAQALLKAVNLPIAAPSANLSTRPSPTRGTHALDDLEGKVPMILESDLVPMGLESSIVDFTQSPPALLRAGAIPFEILKQTLPVLVDKTEDKYGPTVPGAKYRHYTPRCPVIVFSQNLPNLEARLINRYSELKKKGKTPWLILPRQIKGLSMAEQHIFASDEACAEALFDQFRQAEKQGSDEIWVITRNESGLGKSINSRLKKAAAEWIR